MLAIIRTRFVSEFTSVCMSVPPPRGRLRLDSTGPHPFGFPRLPGREMLFTGYIAAPERRGF